MNSAPQVELFFHTSLVPMPKLHLDRWHTIILYSIPQCHSTVPSLKTHLSLFGTKQYHYFVSILSKSSLLSAKKISMQTLNIFLKIGNWLRKYAVLLVLLAILSWEISSTILWGMPPVPQLPPTGYIVEQEAATLQWNKGNIEEPITLQISKTKDFAELVFEKEVTGITHRFKENLERGQKYYWRLMQNDLPSPVSNFLISKQHVKL